MGQFLLFLLLLLSSRRVIQAISDGPGYDMVDPASTSWLQELIGFECGLAALITDHVSGWFFGSATLKYRFVHCPWVRKISLRLLSKQKGSF